MGDKKNQRKFDVGNHFENIFKATDSAVNHKKDVINNIGIEKFVPFKNHPFKLYEGERFTDMVESIKANGIIVPIIVRPLDDGTYEILSGHNRVEAAKAIGLETIPAIVQENLNDDEALLIVTETNLRQRGFESLLHSEKAIALKTHLDVIKSQDKRTALLDEIERLSNPHETNKNSNGGLIDHRTKSRDKTADKYGLDARSVSRYIRLCELNESLLNRVDNNEIGLYPAVSLSYLSVDEQNELNKVLEESKYKVDMKKAESLREHSESSKLTSNKIKQILSGEFNKKPKSTASFRIKYKIYSKYFNENVKHDEAESIIDKALEEYFSKQK